MRFGKFGGLGGGLTARTQVLGAGHYAVPTPAQDGESYHKGFKGALCLTAKTWGAAIVSGYGKFFAPFRYFGAFRMPWVCAVRGFDSKGY